MIIPGATHAAHKGRKPWKGQGAKRSEAPKGLALPFPGLKAWWAEWGEPGMIIPGEHRMLFLVSYFTRILSFPGWCGRSLQRVFCVYGYISVPPMFSI